MVVPWAWCTYLIIKGQIHYKRTYGVYYTFLTASFEKEDDYVAKEYRKNTIRAGIYCFLSWFVGIPIILYLYALSINM